MYLYSDYRVDEGGRLGQPALPSGSSAIRLVQGDSSALPTVFLHWGLHTVLVAAGLYVGGLRSPKLWLYALGGSTAIEAFVLGWAMVHKNDDEKKAT